jgi:YgiT-type zinc finger domain-containing protein
MGGSFGPDFLAARSIVIMDAWGYIPTMNTPKSCKRCGGSLEARKVEHPYWNGITLVAMVQDVPSWVCSLCGYHYFEPAVETTLHYIVKDYIKMGALFPIPSTPYRDVTN